MFLDSQGWRVLINTACYPKCQRGPAHQDTRNENSKERSPSLTHASGDRVRRAPQRANNTQTHIDAIRQVCRIRRPSPGRLEVIAFLAIGHSANRG